MTTLAEFMAEHGIAGTIVEGSTEPPTWSGADKSWTVTFRMADRELVTSFFGGILVDNITLTQVLDTLLGDANTVEAAPTLHEWLRELDMEPTARNRTIFRAAQKQTAKVKAFLGDLYATALWEVDH